MKQTSLFFSQVIALLHYTLPAHVMDALHAVYAACRAINQPKKYGPAIEVIIIDAVHQDYDSTGTSGSKSWPGRKRPRGGNRWLSGYRKIFRLFFPAFVGFPPGISG